MVSSSLQWAMNPIVCVPGALRLKKTRMNLDFFHYLVLIGDREVSSCFNLSFSFWLCLSRASKRRLAEYYLSTYTSLPFVLEDVPTGGWVAGWLQKREVALSLKEVWGSFFVVIKRRSLFLILDMEECIGFLRKAEEILISKPPSGSCVNFRDLGTTLGRSSYHIVQRK